MLNEMNRGAAGECLCCGHRTNKQTTLISQFLAMRAWGGDVEWSDTSRCLTCGFAFHGRGLSQSEVAAYYNSYRDEKYFVDRHACEPFYTRRVHDDLESHMGGEDRRAALLGYLRDTGVPLFAGDDQTVLDYAGGTGRLISGMPGRKYVFDVSGEVPASSVQQLSSSQLDAMKFDLVVCAQMLEHATDPKSQLAALLDMAKPGGHVYVEVPFNETWKDYSCRGRLRDRLLTFAKDHRWFNVVWDMYGTAFRVKLKFLPPLAFVPVREHLNYFTPESLVALGRAVGGMVVDASRIEKLGTTLLLRKPG